MDEIADSELKGRRIVYRSASGLRFEGIVVGESPEGEWVYIKSADTSQPNSKWSFKLKKIAVLELLDQPEE